VTFVEPAADQTLRRADASNALDSVIERRIFRVRNDLVRVGYRVIRRSLMFGYSTRTHSQLCCSGHLRQRKPDLRTSEV